MVCVARRAGAGAGVTKATKGAGDPPPASAFTEELVRALVNEHVLVKRGKTASWQMPDIDALRRLACWLDMFREPYKKSAPLLRLWMALEEIEAVMPAILESFYGIGLNSNKNISAESAFSSDGDLHLFKKFLENKVSREAKEQIQIMEALWFAATAARHPNAIPIVPPELTLTTRKWTDFACLVADELQLAIRSTNPDADLGISNDGPAPRFVAAVLHLITGETLTTSQVAQHLKRANSTRYKT